MVAAYALPLGSDCDTLYFRLAAALEFRLLAACCMVDSHSPLT